MKLRLIRIAVGLTAFITALILNVPDFPVKFILYFASFIIAGYDVVIGAVRNLIRGRIFDETFLMSVATVGAFVIGEFPEGAAVMLFYQTGELFQNYAVDKSRRSIKNLLSIRPDYANLKRGEEVVRVSPEEVSPGDLIVVRPGERVPLDGIIVSGSTSVDMSALSGESLPKDLGTGAEIYSGSINMSGLITVSVTKSAGESTVTKILSLVENAVGRKSESEKFISKFARYYTPAVFFAAAVIAVIPPLAIKGAAFSDWIYRALAFLVVSCPCALVISVPLSFFGGIGRASKEGILIKGANYLETLARAETVVFDKTGTLTKGVFRVRETYPAEGITAEELLKTAARAESHSSHPIALSLKAARPSDNPAEVSEVKEHAGFGVSATIGGKEVLVGNAALMERAGMIPLPPSLAGTPVYVAKDGKYMGSILIADEVKEDSAGAVRLLKEGNIGVVMLSGDAYAIAEETARSLGIDRVHAPLLPDEKLGKLEELLKKKSKRGALVFAGDGINDAPSLARADVGVAMGGLGSDAAIDIADMVIMTDEPSKIPRAIKISKKTLKIAGENIAFALIVKAAALVLSALGITSMWMAVFADVGVSCLAVLNSLRALRGGKGSAGKKRPPLQKPV